MGAPKVGPNRACLRRMRWLATSLLGTMLIPLLTRVNSTRVGGAVGDLASADLRGRVNAWSVPLAHDSVT